MICQRHETVLHIGAQLGDQLNVEGVQQELKKRLGDVALVAKQLAEQLFDQLGNWLAIVNISRRKCQVEQFPSIIEDQMRFEAEELTC